MEFPYLQADYTVLVPVIILVIGALAALLLEVSRPSLRRLTNPVALVALVASAIAFFAIGRTGLDPAANAIASEVGTDLFALAFAPAFYLSALAALVLAIPYLRRSGRQRGEYPALVLFSVSGMVLLVQARDLLVLFLALEALSIPLYVLTGFLTHQRRSVESALKYFTVGAFSSAFVAFGAALTYGASGALSFVGVRDGLATAIASGETTSVLMAQGGLAFLLVGFGFKVAMVPFHAWAADVYQGAPTPVTAFLGVGSKAAGLAALARLLVEVFPDLTRWTTILGALAVLTLVLGNCVAMLQENLKRLIAYSGVSHVGFLLIGLIADGSLTAGPEGLGIGSLADRPGLMAVIFYVVGYSVMTLGALSVVTIVERDYERDTVLVDYAGLARRRPGLAAAMLLFMLSLGGMPPLVGFVGKWLVFQVAIEAGHVALAAAAAITSVIGFYYYLRVVLQMYLRPPREDAAPLEAAPGAWALVGISVACTVVFGLLPWLILRPLVS